MRRLQICLSLILVTTCLGQLSNVNLKPLPGMQFVNRTHRLGRGLVGYWPLNERSGVTVFDLSGHNDSGVITGAIWAAGKSGSALDFNGTSQRVVCENSTAQDIGGKDFTIIARFKLDALVQKQLLVSKDKIHDHGFYLMIDDNGSIDCKVNYVVTDSYHSTAIGSVVAGQWYDVAWVHKPGIFTNYIYKNGIFVGLSVVGEGSYVESTFHLSFGAASYSISSYEVDGLIEFVYFWHRALSAGEIAELYKERDSWMFKRGDIELMAKSVAAPPPAGQLIMINMAAMSFLPFIIILFLYLIRSVRGKEIGK